MRYNVVKKMVWVPKIKYEHMKIPKRVSVHGSLPSPLECYEMIEDGYSIYDVKENTYSNYFYGKILDSEESAVKVAQTLNNR